MYPTQDEVREALLLDESDHHDDAYTQLWEIVTKAIHEGFEGGGSCGSIAHHVLSALRVTPKKEGGENH